ncbi:hypothetical protein ABIB56_001867 [Glaciihabitans sp. UYNi722]
MSELFRIEHAVDPKRTAKSPAFDRVFDAFEGGMHPTASAWKSCGVIRYHFAVSRNNPQKRGSISAASAAETGSYGFHLIPLLNAPWRGDIPERQHAARSTQQPNRQR